MRLARRLAGTLTPAGRGVSLLCLVCLAVGTRLQTPVLGAVGVLLALVLLAATVMVMVPVRVRARVTTQPPQTTVGSSVSGVVQVHNRGPVPAVQPSVHVTVPGRAHRVDVPWLWPGRRVTTSFEFTPERRGVHRLGPVVLEREDPCGLVRWGVRAAAPTELYVRPRTVPVESLGLGQLSDVDGVASDQVSMSDLAFHALREYVRGDDLRHVHWRSSAKADRLLVRQYHDTRRSSVTLLLDTEATAYAGRADFELAVSALASMGVRALRDDLEVSLVAGDEEVLNASIDPFLDACCRVERDERVLARAVGQMLALTPGTGLLVVATGGTREPGEAAAALREVGPGTRSLVVSCRAGADPALRTAGTAAWLELGTLEHLPALLEGYLWESA